MRSRDLMKTDIFTCRTSEPIYRAAEIMLAEGVGFLPVIDNMRRVVGVITDRDLVLRGVAKRLSPQTPTEQLMSSPVISCKALDPLEVVEEKMAEEQKSRIVVLDDFGECVGVISLSDIAQATESGESGELLGRVTEREAPVLH